MKMDSGAEKLSSFDRNQIAGVILSGGRSSRMGGGDKTLLSLGGKPLLTRAIERLAPQSGALAINANSNIEEFSEFGFPVIQDSLPGRQGPLAGILAGLDWAAGSGLDHIVSVAGDTPFFPANLVEKLYVEALKEGAAIAIAATRPRDIPLARHPTFGLWPVALKEDLRSSLLSGTRKIVAWADRHGTVAVEFEIPGFDPFFNINTPEDMSMAERIAEESGN